MKIMVFGSDSSILDGSSSVTKRAIDVSAGMEKYSVIVPSLIGEIRKHRNNFYVYGVSARSKMMAVCKIYFLADRLLKHEKFDLITTPDAYFLAVLGWLLARKYGIKLEIQVHGFEKLLGVRREVAKFILPKADAVRVVSQRLRRMMVADFRVNDKKITVVPVFSPPYESTNNQSINKMADKFVFLTVSRLVPIKNIPLQIEAMAEIIKDFPQAELWIVGDGPDKDRLVEKINNSNLNRTIKMLGQKTRDELDILYRKADVFILTSFAEGWPIVIMEAARYGLPIIMTNVGSAGELIIDSESGLIVPINDKKKLISKMKLLIIDNELRDKIGREALEAVNMMPDREKIIELYYSGWHQALANNKTDNPSISS